MFLFFSLTSLNAESHGGVGERSFNDTFSSDPAVQIIDLGAVPIDSEPTGTLPLEPGKTLDGCAISGCNGEICANEPASSACAVLPHHACFHSATCKRHQNGQCSWEETPELKACLHHARGTH